MPRRVMVMLFLFTAWATADTPAQAAARVLAGGDIKALAARDAPDPWRVVDVLLAQGKHDAAAAFAKAAPRKDTERLPAYVAAQRGKPDHVAARKALAARDPIAASAGIETRPDVVSARLLEARAGALRAAHRLEESAKAYTAAAGIAERIGWHAHAASCLFDAGTSAFYRGDYAGAKASWQRGLAIEEARAFVDGILGVLGNIGVVQQVTGDYAGARMTSDRVLELAQKRGDTEAAAGALANLAAVNEASGDWKRALAYHERALKAVRELANPAHEAGILSNIGLVHLRLGDRAKARRYQERALAIREKHGDRRGIAYSTGIFGVLHAAAGEYAQALEYHERCLKLKQALGDRPGVAQALLDIGAIHGELGDYLQALDFGQRALKAREEMGDRPGAARTLRFVAMIYYSLERSRQALAYAERSLREMRELGDRAGEAEALAAVAIVHQRRGDCEKALDCYRRSMKLGGENANTIGNMGAAYQELGDHEKAAAHYARAFALCKKRGEPTAYLWATGLANERARLGRHAEAVASYEEAIAAIEAQRRETRGFTTDAGARYFERLKRGDPYQGVARALLHLERPADALGYLERGRARGVLDLLARSRVDALAEAERRAREQRDEARLKVIEEVRAVLAAAERDIRAVTHALSLPQTAENRDVLSRKERAARARRDRALAKRALLVRTLLPVGAPANVAAIQRSLAKNERMLYFSVGEEDSLVFVVPPAGGEVVAFTLAIGREDVEMLVRGWVGWIIRDGRRARGLVSTEETPDRNPDAGTRLFEALFPAAVRKQLAGAAHVVVVPHGALHKLPLESLPGKLPPVVYAHSGSVRLWCAQRRAEQRGRATRFPVLAVGDPVFSREKTDVRPPAKGVLLASGRGLLDTGDVLLAYDGRPVSDPRALRREIRRVEDELEDGARKNAPVKARVWRAGRELDLAVPTGSLGVEVAQEPPRAAWPKLREQSLKTLQRGQRSFGPLEPLPGTRREVTAIAKAVEKTVVLLGDDATKARLFELAPRARFLHLATHQLVDETERRGDSRLALTVPRVATPVDDGFLSLYELFEDWRDRLSSCELVVLSACETLKGRLQKDEGPYAMPLGFLYAGAPAVIGSLWRVDDAASAELFADFYRRLAKGTPKLQAFTEARQALRKKYPQPYFWAPFVFIGDPR